MPEKHPDSDEQINAETQSASDSSSEAQKSPYTIISIYRRFRGRIINIDPGGRLLWDAFRSISTILIIVLILSFLTGTSTPLVAVTTGSMEPNINTGDGVIITDYQPSDPAPLANQPDIITVKESHEQTGSHTSLGKEGNVIVFNPSDGGTPIIHRAHFYVEKGENWIGKANPELLGSTDSCDEVAQCPAPNSGFITHGDNNDRYDQVKDHHRPVSKERIIGVGQYRIPHIGIIPNGIDIITP